MRIAAITLSTLALTACNSLLGITDITVGSGDAGTGTCFNATGAGALFMGCPKVTPTGQYTVQANIDTDTDMGCSNSKVDQGAAAPVACVISADSISVPTGHHYVSGNNVLVLIAATTIDIQGTLDASGSPTTTPVLGSVCNNVSSGAFDGSSGGGGGGGAFGDTSGTGGAGGTVSAQGGAGASSINSVVVVRAGCPGAQGGTELPAMTTSFGGTPGGAIYLIAGKSITVEATGVVLANGGGGGGGASNSDFDGGEGGGGGASGGLLGFDSAVVEIDGTVTADGGGGGGGGGVVAGSSGGTANGVAHGTGSTPGANGGDGGADMVVAGDGIAASGDGGGGGAGGSVGYVYIHSPEANTTTGTIDPVPFQN